MNESDISMKSTCLFGKLNEKKYILLIFYLYFHIQTGLKIWKNKKGGVFSGIYNFFNWQEEKKKLGVLSKVLRKSVKVLEVGGREFVREKISFLE